MFSCATLYGATRPPQCILVVTPVMKASKWDQSPILQAIVDSARTKFLALSKTDNSQCKPKIVMQAWVPLWKTDLNVAISDCLFTHFAFTWGVFRGECLEQM